MNTKQLSKLGLMLFIIGCFIFLHLIISNDGQNTTLGIASVMALFGGGLLYLNTDN